ncbi:MAG: hypothetical protein ACPIOQ_44815, partial [Promethearchaeia archaeon]
PARPEMLASERPKAPPATTMFVGEMIGVLPTVRQAPKADKLALHCTGATDSIYSVVFSLRDSIQGTCDRL